MKISYLLILAIIAITILACSKQQEVSIQPQKALEKATSNDRNLRPTGVEKPDLKIYPFSVSGTVTLVSGNYKIPFSLKELNVGTGNDIGAYSDTLKVYQKVPFWGGYNNRFVGNFLRTTNIPAGNSTFMNNTVMFPVAWRPFTGKIHLFIKADDGNTIYESDESNNDSETIWNIYLI